MRPVIGITQCLDVQGRWKPGRDYGYGDLATPRAVEAAGGLPLLLPIQANCEDLLDRIDALLLPGGDDFPPPVPYPADVNFEVTAPEQLDFDRKLLEGALARDLPFLGICYGMQQLAVQLGGTLHYHLPVDVPEAQPHSLVGPNARHPLTVEPHSLLATLLGDSDAAVNSLHHQAVAEPGTELSVSARCPDGIIEAVEASTRRFCIGVQWHPERMQDGASSRLFETFVAAAAAH